MPIIDIEDFEDSTEAEQKMFVNSLVSKINTEHLFTSEVDFIVDDYWTEDCSKKLVVTLSHGGAVEVTREASWQCGTSDHINDMPEDIEYYKSSITDVASVFKTGPFVVDNYKVTLAVDDVDTEEACDVEATNYSNEDDGIGFFEFWGHKGYDSRPYIQVEGNVACKCTCLLTLTVITNII